MKKFRQLNININPNFNNLLALLLLIVLLGSGIWFYAADVASLSINIAGHAYTTLGDDTYISMRYAANLLKGAGLVWNPGQAAVEGFTNFLWVIWIAGLGVLSSDPSLLVAISGALFHLGSVILLFFLLIKNLRLHPVVAFGGAFLLLIWQPIAGQVAAGLESPLYLFLMLVAIFLLFPEKPTQRRLIAGAWFAGLIPLVRPDGLFVTGALGVGFILQYLWPERKQLIKGGLLRYAWCWAGFLAPFLGLTIFRLAYYHDWLPNTYYLKVVDRPGRISFGIDYVTQFLKSFYGTILILPLVVLGFLQKKERWLIAAGLAIPGILAYVAYQGGDAWNWWRFMIPILPFFIILLAVGIGRLAASRWLKAAQILVGLAVLAAACYQIYPSIKYNALVHRSWGDTANNIRLGLTLAQVCDQGAVTADFWAGAEPYYSNLLSIDMLGKSDAHIAHLAAYKPSAKPGHDKFDFDYVIGLKPDVIISNHPGNISKDTIQGVKASDFPFGAYLLENPALSANYVLVSSYLSDTWHGLYFRKDSTKCHPEEITQVEIKLFGPNARMGSGWYGQEKDQSNWWNWSAGEGTIHIMSGQSMPVELRGALLSVKTSNQVTFSLNGQEITSLQLNDYVTSFKPITLDLIPGDNILEIKASNPPSNIEGDKRLLSFGVNALVIKTKDNQTINLMP